MCSRAGYRTGLPNAAAHAKSSCTVDWGGLIPTLRGRRCFPRGVFLAARTETRQVAIHVVGIAPPWHAYRTGERWGSRRLRTWEGNERYWEALAADVLPHVCAPALILGDFNVQLPPRRYPTPDSHAFTLCCAALDGWSIATADIPVDGHTLDKPLVCHIAHTPEIHQIDLTVFSRFDADGFELSDHPCVVMNVKVTP